MDIFTSLYPMLDRVSTHLGRDGIDVSELFLDHVCYRTETVEEYLSTKHIFDTYGTILKEEKMIGGRPIATYKLHTPIEYDGRLIPCVEIPAPKDGSPYRSGWEHAEFVTSDALSVWMARYPHIQWKTDGIGKSINPEIAIMYEDCSVKFHNHPLEYVIMELE